MKDVVLLGTSETVRVIARYAPWDGVYMFHCHNLVHEDHDMMAAFNVSVLSDFGYPETTKFLDPMEQRWRSKDKTVAAFTEQGIQARLQEFYSLDAYREVDSVEKALETYYETKSPKTTPTTPAKRDDSTAAATMTTLTKVTTKATTTSTKK